MELKRLFGRRIKTLREARGLTQADLATLLDRSVDAVSMIERGKNWPSSATIEAIATALQVPLCDLFDDLTGAGQETASDQIAVARQLLKQLNERDLEIAVSLLRAMTVDSNVVS